MPRSIHGNIGIYNATPITLNDGEGAAIALDVNGYGLTSLATAIAGENIAQDVLGTIEKPVVSSSYSGTPFISYGTVTNASITTAPTQIKSISCSNISNALVYIQIFNLAAAPTEDTSVPIFSFPVGAGSATVPAINVIGTEFFGEHGYYLSAGFSWGISVNAALWDSTGVTASNHVVNGVRI